MAFFLGMLLDQDIGGQKLQASLIASILNQQLTRTRVSVNPVLVESRKVRMRPTTPFRMFFYDYEGEGALEVLGSETLRLGPRPDGMVVGDVLRVTSGPLVDSLWTVTELEATTFKATSPLQPIAGSVTWEGGAASVAQVGWRVRITEGLLEGDWEISSVQDALQVSLTGSPASLFLTGQTLRGEGEVGPDGVLFQAALNGRLQVSGAGLFFLLTSSRSAWPTTSWLRLPSDSRVHPGDVLEFYGSGGLTPSSTTVIGRVEEEGGVIQVETSYPSTFTSAMILDPSLPRSQIRSSRYVKLKTLSRSTYAWTLLSKQRRTDAQRARTSFAQAIARSNVPPVQLQQTKQLIETVREDLLSLQTTLSAYDLQPDVLAERVRSLLLSRGYALLAEHWETGNISELFSDSPDRASQAFSRLKEVFSAYLEQDPEERAVLPELQTIVPDEEDEDILYPEDESDYTGGPTIDD